MCVKINICARICLSLYLPFVNKDVYTKSVLQFYTIFFLIERLFKRKGYIITKTTSCFHAFIHVS